MPSVSTLERAFQLAQSGTYASIEALRHRLTEEGYTDATAQTSFPAVRKQLNNLMRGLPAAQPARPRERKHRRRGVLALSFEHT